MKVRIGILLLFIFPLRLASQTESIPLLERVVTICINDMPAQSVLSAIAQQDDFIFSYNPLILPDGNVSICVENKPVRLVLNALFKGSVDYTIRGKYVILKRVAEISDSKDSKEIVEGYVYDSFTGERIKNASVYDKELMLSTITNKYGYFRLEVPRNVDVSNLYFSKQGYADTLIQPSLAEGNFFNITLSSRQILEKTNDYIGKLLDYQLKDSLSRINLLPSWFLTQSMKTHLQNVSDTLFKHVQISFLPYIGTNRLLTGNTANDISINILAGYTQEVRKFEVGGILNIVRNDARYFQFAGVGNIVGGSFNGIQVGGNINIVNHDFEKVQLAGIGNFVGNRVNGYQIGGIVNFCKVFNGLQLSGNINFSSSFVGSQITGIWNESRVGNGLQLSGVVNTSGVFSGIQVAGVGNIANDVDGTQVAGVINLAESSIGLQVAGVANIASYFDGYQVGTINYADSCYGVPFGFFSFVKKGYHQLEFSFDEMRMVSIAFRTGVHLFHNNFIAGIIPSTGNKPLWTYGYGIGTTLGNHSKLSWDFDLSLNRFIKDNDLSSEDDLYRVYTGIDWHIYKKMSIAAGITYNFLFTNNNEVDLNNSIYSLIPYTLSNSSFGSSSNLKTWLGGKISIRFF